MRPNIVFAFADDWGRYASAYARYESVGSLNALIDTPNFDRVADEGVLFLNALVPAPSCTPCRSSVLSGQYFWQTGLGAILVGAVWDESIPTFPMVLEMHIARDGFLPYPQRAIRTRGFIYIINFEPDRWPMGDPKGLDDLTASTPAYKSLAYDTMVAYPDLDASPTKAWMIHHREEQDVEPLYQLAFGKRPREELYDLSEDPDYLHNLADDPSYDNVRKSLEQRLLELLRAENDPRLTEQPCRYEFEPYAGPLQEFQKPDWS